MATFNDEINTLGSAIKELCVRRDKLVDEFKSHCEHSDMHHESKYHSGGYDYSASTTHYYTCKSCGYNYSKNENHNSGFE